MIDGDDRTEARVRAAFHVERLRAEADLQFAPLLPRPRSRPRLFARLAAVAVVTVIAVAAAGLIHDLRIQTATAPSGAPSPTVSQVPIPTSFQATPVPTPDMTGRYSDGIPRTLDGQPVLRWSDALAKRATATDDTSFLTGVWLNIGFGLRSCPNMQAPDPGSGDAWYWIGGCADDRIMADAGGAPTDLNGVATFRFYTGKLQTGPAILRVHLHDSRATQCGTVRTVCGDMIVVEDVLWTGDVYTDPRPFTVADAIAAARSVSPANSLSPLSNTNWGYDAPLPGAIALTCGAIVTNDQTVRGADVFSSAEAMHRALPEVQEGAAGALLDSAKNLYGSNGLWGRWLVVDNVAFSVNVNIEPSGSDRAWLVSLEAGLRARSH
jgi:hypothetical protein